jgi:ferrous iron transport protein B
MDLPLYHAPRIGAVFNSAWQRMKHFVKRAGIIVVAAVFMLSVLNTIGYDNGEISFGNEESQNSVLAYAGKAIAPVFVPIGIAPDNWPASVALFTGLFAKEAIVGTINSLYASMDITDGSTQPAEAVEETGLDIGGAIQEAFTSVGEGLVGVISSVDLLGIGLITEDSEAISEEIGADASVYTHIAANFTVFSAFAYLLFVLMYFPCLAVVGAARQEMGGYYAGVMAVYSTILAWSVATLFYQVAEGHNVLYIALSLFFLAVVYGGLYLIGKKEREVNVPVFAPPVRRDCC